VGPRGEPGPPGVTGITLAYAERTNVSAGEIVRVDAVCPAGTRVTGGGFNLNGTEVEVDHSGPVFFGFPGQEAWSIRAFNPSTAPGFVSVTALCLSIASP